MKHKRAAIQVQVQALTKQYDAIKKVMGGRQFRLITD